jgi:hypothetical protein
VGVRGAREQAELDAAAAALATEQVFLLGLDKMEAAAADGTGATDAPDSTGLGRGLGFRLGLGLLPADFREALVRIERALSPKASPGAAPRAAPGSVRR